MTPNSNDDIFKALGDPTRRALLALLAEEAKSVSDLTSSFSMSQPAVSQHLKVLRDARLVSERRDGRRRIYQLNPEGLLAARQWLDDHVEFWASRFDRLGQYLGKKNGENA